MIFNAEKSQQQCKLGERFSLTVMKIPSQSETITVQAHGEKCEKVKSENGN